MIKLSRGAALTLAYYGGASLVALAALVCLLLRLYVPAIALGAGAALWLFGGMALCVLFDPALTRWINEELAEQPRRRQA